MFTIQKITIISVITLITVTNIFAGYFDGKHLQTNWTTESGLPQNSITSIVKTFDGYMWLGTYGGLVRFDGVNFKIYNSINTPELRNNQTTALAVATDGTLYIGTSRGLVLSHQNGQFQTILEGQQNEFAAISDIKIDLDNSLFISTFRGPIICKLGICEVKKLNDKEDSRKQFGFTKAMWKDDSGLLWAQSNFAIYTFKDDEFIEDTTFTQLADTRKGRRLERVEKYPLGGILALVKKTSGEPGNEIVSFELLQYQNNQIKKIFEINGDAKSCGFTISPDNAIWINAGNKVYRYFNETAEILEIDSKNQFGANKIYFDDDGIVWLGRLADGLYRLLESRVQTIKLSVNDKNQNIFQELAANSLVEDKDGSVWISAASRLFHWKDGKLESFTSDPSLTQTFARGAVYIDTNNVLWNATSTGLQNFKDGKFSNFQDLSWTQASNANSFFQDSAGNYWYGCPGCGVIQSDGTKILNKYTTKDGLSGDRVVVIIQSKDGAIWFGTASGLSQFKNNTFTNYGLKDGLSNEYVRDIYEDTDGTFWIATYGGGLNRLKDGKITAITSEDGLYEDAVSRILVDDDDKFWMLGNRGIFVARRADLNDFADGKLRHIYCEAYTTADGMSTSEGNGGFQNAGIRTKDGKFWFPMINGVVVIDPNRYKQSLPTPLIDEVYLNGYRVADNQRVEINPGSESFDVKYTGLNFRKPEQIRFRYRMTGMDKEWTDAGYRRLVTYPYLPWGNFTFEVSAANGEGKWSDETAKIQVIVHPPFYRTWWFTALLALITILILLSFFKYRNWIHAKETAKQKEFSRKLINTQEFERRRIAAEIHDNLGQQLLIIKNWAAYCLKKFLIQDKK